MNKLFKNEEKRLEEEKKYREWYERMNRQMEWDSQFEDFSIPEDWDKDFLEAMEKASVEKERKKRRKKKIQGVAACLVLGLLGVGINQREAIGECLKEVFVHRSTEAGLDYIYFGTEEDLSIIPDKEQTRFSFDGNTLEEVYVQMKENIKRPFFQIKNELGECEIIDAYYEEKLNLVVIVLETQEGRIYLSQEERLDDGGTGARHEGESMMVWNENLKQYIIISKSVQDDSYSFFVKNLSIIFNFHGYVSGETSRQIAKNLVFE